MLMLFYPGRPEGVSEGDIRTDESNCIQEQEAGIEKTRKPYIKGRFARINFRADRSNPRHASSYIN